MKNITKIYDFLAPELDMYTRLTGPELRASVEGELGVFIAESPTVIEVAIKSGCEVISLLTDERLINSSVKKIIEMLPDSTPIYTATEEVLKKLTGFALTRGALAAMKRPPLPDLTELIKDAGRIAVLENIADSTNIGALFRAAAALGIDAVLVTPACCDPLCRRAVRVSMGTIFQVKWTKIGKAHSDWPYPAIDTLKDLGFKTCAMALTDESVSIDDEQLRSEEKLAIILGTEGDGLKSETIARCDYTAKIPMSNSVDSLNVASAGAVAFWVLTR